MIKVVYHASDGTQHASRAEAQRYERVLEFLAWLSADWGGAERFALPEVLKNELASRIARRWYLHDRQAPRKRGKPHFTGKRCMLCGGQVELIAGMEVCVACRPEDATHLREKELTDAT